MARRWGEFDASQVYSEATEANSEQFVGQFAILEAHEKTSGTRAIWQQNVLPCFKVYFFV